MPTWSSRISLPHQFQTREITYHFTESLIENVSVFQKLEDVTFIVGNKEIGIEHIRGNKTIFAVHSEVLRAQVFGKVCKNQQRMKL